MLMLHLLKTPALVGISAVEGHRTLVLNGDETPLSYPLTPLNAHDTLAGLVLNRYEVLRWSQTWVRSVNVCLQLPSILRLKETLAPIRLQGTPMLTLEHLYVRDNGLCQYTGRPLRLNKGPLSERASIDHVIPRSRGGADVWENVVLCNTDLNSRKSSFLPEDMGLKLLEKPWVPTGADLLKRWLTEGRLNDMPDDWHEFLRPEKVPLAA
jgi:hypothetical protein